MRRGRTDISPCHQRTIRLRSAKPGVSLGAPGQRDQRDQSEAFYDGTGQDFSFFDARGFFANSSNADAQEDVALKHVKSAGDRIADPVARRSAAPCSPPPRVLGLTLSRQRSFLLP